LKKSILAFKSFKNFSFENCQHYPGIGREKDLINFYISEQSSRKSWIFVAAQKFDSLFIKSEFEKSDDLTKINAKEINFN